MAARLFNMHQRTGHPRRYRPLGAQRRVVGTPESSLVNGLGLRFVRKVAEQRSGATGFTSDCEVISNIPLEYASRNKGVKCCRGGMRAPAHCLMS